jgi:competence protein ComEC
LLDPSFEMSFGAVIGLISAYEWWGMRKRAAKETPRLPFVARSIIATALTSLIAEASTAPFAAYHFNQFQSMGLIGNQIVVPLLSFFIMPLGVIAILAMPFGLEHWPLKLMGWGIEQMLSSAHWTASLPGAVTYLKSWPAFALIVMVIGGLWLALWRGRWRIAGAPLAAAGLLVALAWPGADAFIGEEGDSFAFRTRSDHGWSYGLIGVRPTSYRGGAWLKALGVNPAAPLKASPLVTCDALGCTVPVGRGQEVSLVRDGRALAEECTRQNVLVSLVRIEGDCAAPRAHLDSRELRNNAAALRFDGASPHVTFAAEGARPWRHAFIARKNNDD